MGDDRGDSPGAFSAHPIVSPLIVVHDVLHVAGVGECHCVLEDQVDPLVGEALLRRADGPPALGVLVPVATDLEQEHVQRRFVERVPERPHHPAERPLVLFDRDDARVDLHRLRLALVPEDATELVGDPLAVEVPATASDRDDRPRTQLAAVVPVSVPAVGVGVLCRSPDGGRNDDDRSSGQVVVLASEHCPRRCAVILPHWFFEVDERVVAGNVLVARPGGNRRRAVRVSRSFRVALAADQEEVDYLRNFVRTMRRCRKYSPTVGPSGCSFAVVSSTLIGLVAVRATCDRQGRTVCGSSRRPLRTTRPTCGSPEP